MRRKRRGAAYEVKSTALRTTTKAGATERYGSRWRKGRAKTAGGKGRGEKDKKHDSLIKIAQKKKPATQGTEKSSRNRAKVRGTNLQPVVLKKRKRTITYRKFG